MVAVTGLESLTKKVSFRSLRRSPRTRTETNAVVLPAKKVRVPEVARRSGSAVRRRETDVDRAATRRGEADDQRCRGRAWREETVGEGNHLAVVEIEVASVDAAVNDRCYEIGGRIGARVAVAVDAGVQTGLGNAEGRLRAVVERVHEIVRLDAGDPGQAGKRRCLGPAHRRLERIDDAEAPPDGEPADVARELLGARSGGRIVERSRSRAWP
jgi:hypothetical protein